MSRGSGRSTVRALARALGAATLALVVSSGCAPDGAPPAATGSPGGVTAVSEAARPTAPCEEISVHCGNTPTLAFDSTGRLWAAYEQNGRVWVTGSDDLGQTFSPPVPVGPEAESIETNGEGRPKVALGPEGEIYVSWTRKTGRFTGEIRFSRSLDGGASFAPATTVNDDGLDIGHRFEALLVDGAGDVYLAWVDKRDLEAAKERDEAYRGAAVYYTVSTDRGETFAPNRLVAHHACECCRIGITAAPDGGAAILWRHVFEPNERDHALAVLGTEGASPLRRASREGWKIDACPHHGPALVPVANGYHMSWFTAADGRPRLYYGRFDATSGTTSALREIADGPGASHPDIAIAGGQLTVAWLVAESDRASVRGIVSTDEGTTWSEPRALASTAGNADHPFLMSRDDEVYLAWHTALEGLRVIPIGAGG